MIYSYRRASTDEQQLGPQAQADTIKKWLVSQGIGAPTDSMYIAGIYADFCDMGVSGSVPLGDRIAGNKLLLTLRPGDTIVAAKLDRLFRSTADAATTIDSWCKNDVKLVSVHEGFDMTTSMGKFMSSVMAAFAELERAMIRERTSAALQRKIANGDHHGGIPYGWNRVKGKLLANYEEQKVIGLIRNLMRQGLFQESVADYLNRHGIPSKRGGKWSQKTVSHTLAFDEKARTIGVKAADNPETRDELDTAHNAPGREPGQLEGGPNVHADSKV